jgi:hypothetical protein
MRRDQFIISFQFQTDPTRRLSFRPHPSLFAVSAHGKARFTFRCDIKNAHRSLGQEGRITVGL